MEKIVVKYASTKRDADDVAVQTKITLDHSGVNEAEIQEIANSACIIKAQAKLRNMKEIPSEYLYHVPRPGTRVAETLDDKIAKLSKEEKEALIEKLMKG